MGEGNRPYLDEEARRKAIIAAALLVATRHGWLAVTTRRVAAACEPECSPSLVNRLYGGPKSLRDAALTAARDRGAADLIAAADALGL